MHMSEKGQCRRWWFWWLVLLAPDLEFNIMDGTSVKSVAIFAVSSSNHSFIYSLFASTRPDDDVDDDDVLINLK